MDNIHKPMLTHNSSSNTNSNHQENDHFKRAPAVSPQKTEKGELKPSFRLCNADGTPLSLRIVSSSSDENESEGEHIDNSEENDSDISMTASETAVDDKEQLTISWMEESSDEELPSEFLSFIAVEELRKMYPPLDEQLISDKISQMFTTTERTPVEFTLIQKKREANIQAGEKLKALKEKKDTGLERVRNEFNRVTEENLTDVVNNLLNIKIEKIDDMKEIAGFVFEKSISERVYLRVYTTIIGRLKKVWRTAEELSMPEKGQTCFFGVLLKYIVSRITERQKWSAQPDIKAFKGTRQEIEQQIEECETERLTRKARATGAVELLLSLYNMNVIGPSNLTNVVNQLVSGNSSAEHVEMVIMILKTVTEKLVSNKKNEVVLQMVKFLKSNMKKHDGRVDFLIESTIGAVQKHIVLSKVEQHGNMFAALVKEGEEEEEEPCEEDVLYDYVSRLGSSLSKAATETDKMAIKKDIEGLLKVRSNEMFFTLLFAEIVSNYKLGDALREFFMSYLVEMPGSLKSSLRDLKERLGMLTIDFPISTSKYAEFLCHLRGADLIDAQFFESLKTNEFLKKSEMLQQKWKECNDPRFAVVFKR